MFASGWIPAIFIFKTSNVFFLKVANLRTIRFSYYELFNPGGIFYRTVNGFFCIPLIAYFICFAPASFSFPK
ncbi:hypothetical protein LEP1GSC005_2415 [Leptospira santarosai str. ST188]|nr:hypothetical protein LEP1GSC005_2415 [Leptospira santarosai str. ST188]